MPSIKLEVSEVQVKLLSAFYSQRLQELNKEREEITLLLNKLNKDASSLNGNEGSELGVGVTNNSSGYNPKWSLVKKAKFIINEKGTALTTKNMVDYIIQNYEPNLEKDRKRFLSSLSGILSSNSQADGSIFTREKNDTDDFEYKVREKQEITPHRDIFE